MSGALHITSTAASATEHRGPNAHRIVDARVCVAILLGRHWHRSLARAEFIRGLAPSTYRINATAWRSRGNAFLVCHHELAVVRARAYGPGFVRLVVGGQWRTISPANERRRQRRALAMAPRGPVALTVLPSELDDLVDVVRTIARGEPGRSPLFDREIDPVRDYLWSRAAMDVQDAIAPLANAHPAARLDLWASMQRGDA